MVNISVIDYLYIPLIGLYLTHYLIGRGFRSSQMRDRGEDRWGFGIRFHELVIRTVMYLFMSTILFWHVVGNASFIVAIALACMTVAIDYWRMYHLRTLSFSTRLFIGRNAVVQLAYTLLFLSVACVAYTLRTEGVIPN